MNLNEEVELLKGVPIFSKIEPAQAEAAGLHQRAREFRRRPGGLSTRAIPGDTMYVILGGTADVLIDTPSGQIAVAEMKKNSFFGEIAILCDVPRTATIKAQASR